MTHEATKKLYKFIEGRKGNLKTYLSKHENVEYVISTDAKLFYKGNSIDIFSKKILQAAECTTEKIDVTFYENENMLNAYSFTANVPETQSTHYQPTEMAIDTQDIAALLGNMPQSPQLLGVIYKMQSESAVDRVTNDYERKLQAADFEKRQLEAQITTLKEEKEKAQRRCRSISNELKSYQSEEKILGNMSIAEHFGKSFFSGYCMIKAADSDNESKTAKFMDIAGALSGVTKVQEVAANPTPNEFMNSNHPTNRLDDQRGLFAYMNGVDNNTFCTIYETLMFMFTPENAEFVNTVLLPKVKAKDAAAN